MYSKLDEYNPGVVLLPCLHQRSCGNCFLFGRATLWNPAKRRTGCMLWMIAGLAVWPGAAQPAYAHGATRDLSDYSGPGVMFTVSISIDPPPGTGVVGLEDVPPAGWSVSSISNGGIWVTELQMIKWLPFYDPSIPEAVTYDVTPPDQAQGIFCFAGNVSFDGPDRPIGGDECIPIGVPTLSEWGMVAMTLLVLTGGTLVLIRRRSRHTQGYGWNS